MMWKRYTPLIILALCTTCARQPIVVSNVPPPEKIPEPVPKPTASSLRFEATAYSIEGETRSGKEVRPGMVAADPSVLPLGSRIRVHGAGRYSGVYRVEDTGKTVKGREIDIYIPSAKEALQFGRQSVQVEVLDRGTP